MTSLAKPHSEREKDDLLWKISTIFTRMAGIEPYQYEPMASHNGSVDWSSEDDENFETQRSSREIDVAEW